MNVQFGTLIIIYKPIQFILVAIRLKILLINLLKQVLDFLYCLINFNRWIKDLYSTIQILGWMHTINMILKWNKRLSHLRDQNNIFDRFLSLFVTFFVVSRFIGVNSTFF